MGDWVSIVEKWMKNWGRWKSGGKRINECVWGSERKGRRKRRGSWA